MARGVEPGNRNHHRHPNLPLQKITNGKFLRELGLRVMNGMGKLGGNKYLEVERDKQKRHVVSVVSCSSMTLGHEYVRGADSSLRSGQLWWGDFWG